MNRKSELQVVPVVSGFTLNYVRFDFFRIMNYYARVLRFEIITIYHILLCLKRSLHIIITITISLGYFAISHRVRHVTITSLVT